MKRVPATSTPKLSDVLLRSIDSGREAAVWESPSTLRPWIDNPKKHEKNVNDIIESLQKFGFGRSVLARQADKEIIAGHGTILAAERLGLPRVPVRYVDLEPRLAHGLALADNRIPELEKTDNDLLIKALAEQKIDIKTFEATGYKYDDFFPSETKQLDEDEIPEPPKKPIAKLGDTWKCGDHLFICGDSHKHVWEAKQPLWDMVLTDPPYAVYGSSTGIGADITDDKMIRPFFDATFEIIGGRVKEFGHVYVCCDWRSYPTIYAAATPNQLSPRNLIVWDKGNNGVGSMYQLCHEFVAFFARMPPPKAMISTTKKGHRLVRGKPNIYRATRPTGDERKSNAAKPVKMFRDYIENSSDEDNLVVDMFAGPGTSLVAGEQSKRRTISFDIKPSEVDKAIIRWETLTGRKAKRV